MRSERAKFALDCKLGRMRILVTGGTGFVGSHAVESLVSAGFKVRLLARSSEKVAHVSRMRGVQLDDVEIGEMGDADACQRALKGCDGVLHTAAAFTIGPGASAQAENAAGNRNILGAAAEMGLDPIVYTSSVAALFPPQGPVLHAEDPVGELRSDYGRSKTDGEHYARELQDRGAPIHIVYPAGVYGPDDPGMGPGAKGLRDRLRFGWPLGGGGTSCIDVRDLALICTRSMKPGQGPRRYMAGGHFLSWEDEADLCEEITGRPVRRIRASRSLLYSVGLMVDGLQRIFPSFDYPLTSEAARFVTDFVPCDSSNTLDYLGLTFRDTRETLGDAIRWLVASGNMAPHYAGRLGHAPRQNSS